MAKVEYAVEFRGTTTIEFDPDADYPERYALPGGEAQLAEDLFYAYADLVGGPFGNDGRTEFVIDDIQKFDADGFWG